MNQTAGRTREKQVADGDGRIPPSDLQAEQAVLGAILISDIALAKVLDRIREGSFYWQKHSLIFRAILSLSQENEPTDLITVSQRLRADQALDEVGGDYYLTELAESVPFPLNADHYAQIVEEKFLLRQLIEAGADIGSRAFDPAADPESLLDKSLGDLFKLQGYHDRGGYQDLKQISHSTIEVLTELYEHKGDLTGVTAGYPDLDKKTGGFQKADLIILAARPSMGKTALGLGFAYHAAIIKRVPVGIISLEMNTRQIAMRLLSMSTRIPLNVVRNANFNSEQWRKVVDGASRLSQLPLYIDDSSTQTITDIRARARRLQMQHDVGLLVLDYLQLIQPPDRVESQQQFIAMVSRQLKGLSKELDIPIIAISQLSRAPETRGGSKRPILSDLRDSGAIEQDADVVMFIYRKSYYDHLEGKDKQEGYIEDNTAEVIIAKQRNGPTGSVELLFKNQYASFENLSREAREPTGETPF